MVGSELRTAGPPQLSLRVVTPRELEFVEVIRNGQSWRRFDGPGREMAAAFADAPCRAGTYSYFVRVKTTGEPSFNAPGQPDFLRPFRIDGRYPSNLANARGPFAWTSPIWVDVQ